MIIVKNVKNIRGEVITLEIPSDDSLVLDAEGRLTALPAPIDSHVHFRTPGHEYKEDWLTGARAAVAGGITTVIDMPNNQPSCITLEGLREKKALIDRQLVEAGIPLRYELYLGADKYSLEEMRKAKDEVIGLKVFMGSSTGGLLMDDDIALEAAFKLAGEEDFLISVHAEDEDILRMKKAAYGEVDDPTLHPKIRHRSAAITATNQAIRLAEKHGNRLHVLHLGTKEEVVAIREAKKRGVRVTSETSPHHLCLTDCAYREIGTLAQVNPPIRTQEDQDALWFGIRDGTIDTIGSDHAPHSLEEKHKPYGKAPSGMPGVQTTLPLILDACHQGKITLEQLVDCLCNKPREIFALKPNDDWVLVDLEKQVEIRNEDMLSKCGWTAYAGRLVTGYPIYTILRGRLFPVDDLKEKVHVERH